MYLCYCGVQCGNGKIFLIKNSLYKKIKQNILFKKDTAPELKAEEAWAEAL